MKYVAKTEKDTAAAARELAPKLKAPVTVAFTGGLGAGKTTFIRYLCRELGYDGAVTSPTYAIMNVYEGRVPIYHYDAYRLSGGDELIEAGYGDLCDTGISLIEWSENVEDGLLGRVIRADVFSDGQTRIITIDGVDEDADA